MGMPHYPEIYVHDDGLGLIEWLVSMENHGLCTANTNQREDILRTYPPMEK